jgi:hypothetical protein
MGNNTVAFEELSVDTWQSLVEWGDMILVLLLRVLQIALDSYVSGTCYQKHCHLQANHFSDPTQCHT